MSLQISCIKSIFENLTKDEQNNLICDLMEISKIDSVIGPNRRTTTICDIEINAPENETLKEIEKRKID